MIRILLGIIILYSCSDQSNDQLSIQQDQRSEKDPIVIDSISNISIDSLRTCDCKVTNRTNLSYNESEILRFPNNINLNDSVKIWLESGNDPKSIKSIECYAQNGRIPSALFVFSELEELRIQHPQKNGLEGISSFKKLIKLRIDEARCNFIDELVAINTLVILDLKKCQLSGEIPSEFISRLQYLNIGYAALGNGQLDLTQAHCLKGLSIGGLMNSLLELSEIDFKSMHCLMSIDITDTYGNISGFPTNLENSNLDKFYFYSRNMSQQEKELYNRYKK